MLLKYSYTIIFSIGICIYNRQGITLKSAVIRVVLWFDMSMPNSEGMVMFIYHIMWWLMFQDTVIFIAATLRISVSLGLNL